jgi:cell division protein FtsW (lipid II flippase)
MFDFSNLGKILVVVGLVVAGIGLVMILAGKIPWLGKLPGDFFYRGKNFTFYFPLMTCLIASVILTLILWFINRR